MTSVLQKDGLVFSIKEKNVNISQSRMRSDIL